MEIKNAVIVGLGSMGRRRARLLKKIDRNIKIYGVDISKEKRDEVKKDTFEDVFLSISDCVEVTKSQVAFICTSPLSHREIIKTCLINNMNVFTEINLVSDGYDELIDMSKALSKTLFLSSTQLYRRDIEYIINKFKGVKSNYIYHVGQYLPDWHPWESYKDFFVGDKRTNGCREIFAIELPWIIAAMGEIEEFHVISDKMTNLDIDYFDNYIVTFKHQGGSKGCFCVDVVSRQPMRSLEIFSENHHVTWKGTPTSLIEYDINEKKEREVSVYKSIDSNPVYSDSIIENAYEDEIKSFFECIENGKPPKYTFQDDYVTLELIDKIEGERI